jgi:predicted nucleic acid-binding protein
MNLFIDTNVFLSFYHFSSDDLEELRKLAVLVYQHRLNLYLPEQIVDEFNRNRDGKIAEAIKSLRAATLPDQFPHMCKEYEEYKKMRTAARQFSEAKSQLLERLATDISQEHLRADEIIRELFGTALHVQVTEEMLHRASCRHDLGNPPGKKDSYGDAVNWECLLEAADDGEDLYFVSGDQDYCSQVDHNEFSPFLQGEWNRLKGSKIVFFTRLSLFFKDQFPDIELASELEKELLIQDLQDSPTFASTRQTLRKLVRCSDFSPDQLNDIVAAAISNNQVFLIATDSDISSYLKRIVKGGEEHIDPQNLKRFRRYLHEKEEEDVKEEEDF